MAEGDRMLRDALTIVTTGVVLGLAYNQLALANRPPRGLAWVAKHEALESVESLQGSGAETSAKAASTLPTQEPPATAPLETPVVEREPAIRPGRQATTATVKSSTSAAPSAPTRASSPEAADPPAASATLPDIPDAQRPLKIELANVKKFIDANAAMIIDAREADEFAAGHLPGAINLSVDDAARDPDRLERLDSKGMPIIVYCGGGDCEASRMIAESLMRDYRKKRVLVFEGGFPEWSGAGFPVAR
jgi:rhodanese-related sulfurtransferase